MRVLTLLFALLCTSAQALSSSDPADTRLTPAQVAADIALAEKAYKRIHPGYTRYADAQDLQAQWAQIIAQSAVNDGLRLGDFYLQVQTVLASIRCDHTKAELNPAIKQDRKQRPVHLPVRWRLIGGRAFVIDPVAGTGINAKDEILAIDGVPMAELIARWARLVPVDGYTDHVRELELAESAEFAGGAIEHFGALQHTPLPVATLRLQSRGEAPRTVEAARLTFPDWHEHAERTGGDGSFAKSVSWKPVGEQAAYLRVGSFINYRDPVDPDDIYAPIFRRLAEQQRSTLIVDLRDNGGGSDDASISLFRHLLSEPAALKREVRLKTIKLGKLTEHISTWDKRAINPSSLWFKKLDDGSYRLRPMIAGDEVKRLKPAKHAFDGKLILLTSRANSSGSTHVLARLKDLAKRDGREIVTVGEETGGSAEGATAGIIFFLTLPESGLRLRVPAQRSYMEVSEFVPGKGLIPDVHAPLTAMDWLAGRDPAMEAAMAIIENAAPEIQPDASDAVSEAYARPSARHPE